MNAEIQFVQNNTKHTKKNTPRKLFFCFDFIPTSCLGHGNHSNQQGEHSVVHRFFSTAPTSLYSLFKV